MLVISSYKKGDTICVKVSTGEEIVGRFESQDGDVQVIKPCVITLNPQNGQAMLIPWLMSVDVHSTEPVTVSQDQIVAMYKPSKGIADVYLQGSSGIAMPNRSDTEKLTGLL